MPWVVKTLKPELLRAAERESRQVRRAAARETADADAYLQLLEELGSELLEQVGGERRARRADRVGRKRSDLRESPLAELFRATG